MSAKYYDRLFYKAFIHLYLYTDLSEVENPQCIKCKVVKSQPKIGQYLAQHRNNDILFH